MDIQEIKGTCQWMQTQCSDCIKDIDLMPDHPGSGKVRDELVAMKAKLQTVIDAVDAEAEPSVG